MTPKYKEGSVVSYKGRIGLIKSIQVDKELVNLYDTHGILATRVKSVNITYQVYFNDRAEHTLLKESDLTTIKEVLRDKISGEVGQKDSSLLDWMEQK